MKSSIQETLSSQPSELCCSKEGVFLVLASKPGKGCKGCKGVSKPGP